MMASSNSHSHEPYLTVEDDKITPALNYSVSSALEPYLQPTPTLQTSPLFPKKIDRFLASALIFDASSRLLVLQRSGTDTLPHRWEVPGGCADAEDPSVVHAAVRELFEETGLRAASVRCVVGKGHVFEDDNPTKSWVWCRLAFLVEVEGGEDVVGRVVVDEAEHQDWAWATEEEVRTGRVGGKEVTFVSERMKGVMLEGFQVRKEM